MRTLSGAFKTRPRQRGFTLIEVLIAIGLLSLMSIAIFQITVRSFDVNFRLSTESTDYIAIVLSLQTVEADLAQIYTPVIDTKATPKDPNSQAKEFWSAPVRSDGIRRSRLKGGKEKLTFVNNGNRRVEEDSPQSDFQKVTWEIERNTKGTYTLYRTTDWNAFQYDDTIEKKPARVALLDNLSSAQFRFYRKETQKWEDEWDSESTYAKPDSRYPDLISLKIELPDPTNPANQTPWEVTVKPNLRLNGPEIKTTGREVLE